MADTQRAHILIPGDLLREIDDLVGPRGRSAFLLETARQEVQRRKLLRFLESERPAWRAQDHPELDGGAAVYVRQLRRQSEKRETTGHGDRSQTLGQRRANSVRDFKTNRSK
jgi:hypothetical protein